MPSACSETCIPQQDSVQQTPCNRTICGRTSKSLISPTANSCTLLSSALDVQQMASNGVPSCLPYKPNCCLRAVVGGTFVRDSKACQLVAAVHDVRHAPHVEPRRSKPHLEVECVGIVLRNGHSAEQAHRHVRGCGGAGQGGRRFAGSQFSRRAVAAVATTAGRRGRPLEHKRIARCHAPLLVAGGSCADRWQVGDGLRSVATQQLQVLAAAAVLALKPLMRNLVARRLPRFGLPVPHERRCDARAAAAATVCGKGEADLHMCRLGIRWQGGWRCQVAPVLQHCPDRRAISAAAVSLPQQC
mmetsp:Transcript_33932/g.100997  ORF Transcript_33932/g.100997 Transcript_33932/m.100997 type:complete len:301 (-) Transcript_33932:788-1690(-)